MLTHEEAYLCRLFVEDPIRLQNYAKARRFLLHGQVLICDQVEQLLAEYNAEWVMVRRADLGDAMQVVNNEVSGWDSVQRLNAALEDK